MTIDEVGNTGRREFLRRMAMAGAFVVPAVASYSMVASARGSVLPANGSNVDCDLNPSDPACSAGSNLDPGAPGGSNLDPGAPSGSNVTTTTSSSTTTVAPTTTTVAPTTTVAEDAAVEEAAALPQTK